MRYLILLLSLSLVLNLYGQVSVELSSRSRWNLPDPQRRFPPATFITVIPFSFYSVGLGFEGHIDYGIQDKEWPNVGLYSVREVHSGYGFILRWRHNVSKHVWLRASYGSGRVHTQRDIITNDSLLNTYLLPPIQAQPKIYLYFSMGLEYRLNRAWHATLDYGSGYRWLSLGVNYRFEQNENN